MRGRLKPVVVLGMVIYLCVSPLFGLMPERASAAESWVPADIYGLPVNLSHPGRFEGATSCISLPNISDILADLAKSGGIGIPTTVLTSGAAKWVPDARSLPENYKRHVEGRNSEIGSGALTTFSYDGYGYGANANQVGLTEKTDNLYRQLVEYHASETKQDVSGSVKNLTNEINANIECLYKVLHVFWGKKKDTPYSASDPLSLWLWNESSTNVIPQQLNRLKICVVRGSTVQGLFANKEYPDFNVNNPHDNCYMDLKSYVAYYMRLRDIIYTGVNGGPSVLQLIEQRQPLDISVFAHMGEDANTASVSGEDHCGGGSGWNPAVLMRRALCSLVVEIRKSLLDLLGSSLNLMATTSGFSNFTVNAPTEEDWFHDVNDSRGLQEISQPLEQTLEKARKDTSDTQIGKIMREGYQRVLKFLDSILIIIFFIVAIANILQIEINKYSLKKLAPGFLWGFLAAHFSYFIMQVLLEFSGVMSRFIMGMGEAKGSTSTFLTAFDLTAGNTPADPLTWGQIFKVGFFNLFILFAIIIVLILAFLFICRIVVFAVAIPLAPLAFFGLFFQPASSIWNRWWKTVSGWIFMPVAVSFCLWLAFMYATAGSNVREYGFIGQLLSYIIFAFLLIQAIKLPFSWAGEAKMVMDKWAGFGKAVTSPVTNGAKTGAKLAGYGMLNNRLGYDANGNKIKGIGGGLARIAGAPGKLAGKAVRINKRMQDNSKEKLEDAKDRLFNGPIDPEAQRRRLAADERLRKLNTAEKDFKNTHALNATKKAAELRVKELDDEIAQLKTLPSTPANDAAIRAKEGDKRREEENAKRAEDQMRRDFETDFRGRNNGRGVEEERSRLIAEKEAPQSVFERVDQGYAKSKAAREAEKSFRDESQKNMETMAKESLYRTNTSIRDVAANAERLKESTGILDDLTQKIVKTKKNELQAGDDYLTALKKRQIIDDNKAEKAETERDVKFFEALSRDAAVLDAKIEKEAQKEVREKKEKAVMNTRLSDQVHDFGLHAKIIEAVSLGRTAEAESLARQLKNASLRDNLLRGVDMNGVNVSIGTARTSSDIQGLIDAHAGFGNAENFKAVRRRMQVTFDKGVGEDVDLYADTGMYKSILFDNNSENLRHIIDGDFVALDPSGNPRIDPTTGNPEMLDGTTIRETAIAHTAFAQNLNQGRIIGADAAKIREAIRLERDRHPVGTERYNDLNSVFTTLDTLSGPNITERNSKSIVDKVKRSDAWRRLGLHPDYIKSPDKQFTPRKTS